MILRKMDGMKVGVVLFCVLRMLNPIDVLSSVWCYSISGLNTYLLELKYLAYECDIAAECWLATCICQM